ncbi:MAG: ABC transporter permease [Chloroflexi bacterium]|nr:ABC transporter permease [Chloroflexota bacterium]
MQRYILRRILLFVPTLLLGSLMVFAIMRVLPGDVAYTILAGGEGAESLVTEADLQRVREQLGLADPLVVQYGKWMRDMFTGNLGTSMFDGRPVTTLIRERLPVTMTLAFYTMILSVFVAIPLGVIAALKHDNWLDYLIRSATILGLATPNFWIGLIIILLLVLFFRWMPSTIYFNVWENPKENVALLIFPAVVLAWRLSSYQARMTRSNLLEVLRQDYIRTAYSKGLAARIVVIRHALRNALLPVVTLVGAELAVLLGGAVILENVFNIPGLGNALIISMQQRDYPVTQSLALLFMVFTLVINLIVDISYGFIDPRIRYT